MKQENTINITMEELLVAKLDAFAVHNGYRLDPVTLGKIFVLYKGMEDIVEDSFGEIVGVEVSHEGVTVRANVQTLTVYHEKMGVFLHLLTLADKFSAIEVNGDYLIVTVSMQCVWKEV